MYVEAVTGTAVPQFVQGWQISRVTIASGDFHGLQQWLYRDVLGLIKDGGRPIAIEFRAPTLDEDSDEGEEV